MREDGTTLPVFVVRRNILRVSMGRKMSPTLPLNSPEILFQLLIRLTGHLNLHSSGIQNATIKIIKTQTT